MSQWAPTVPYSRPVDTNAVFGRTMSLVAITVACFAGGAWLARDLAPGMSTLAWLAAFGCMIAMQFMRRAGSNAGLALLFTFGALMGVASAPTLSYYASAEPGVVAQAGAATALVMAGLGAAGYGTRRDLSGVARISSWALLGLILFGIVTIFVHIPGAGLLYSVLGLVIFAGLTMFDFQRLRQTSNLDSAPMLAMSIFLDALNIFMFLLQLFGGGSRRN